MKNEDEVRYHTTSIKDTRFAGRFFVAIRTTGIYGRPTCPLHTPKVTNCQFFSSSKDAEKAGYRPCLRCRPEVARNLPASLGTANTVTRALRLIDEGALDVGSVADLAGRLGVGERYLRRLFSRRLGLSPTVVAHLRRVQVAGKLIVETTLPMSEIALAAGFLSLRRFNDAIRLHYGKSPRELRRDLSPDAQAGVALSVQLPFVPPYNWGAVLWQLAQNAIPGVEVVDQHSYRRVIAIDGQYGTIEVSIAERAAALNACIRFTNLSHLQRIIQRLRRMLDLDANITAIMTHLSQSSVLRDLIDISRGARVVGAWDGFELAASCILTMGMPDDRARQCVGRIVGTLGQPVPREHALPGLTHVFPRPGVLARADMAAFEVPADCVCAVREFAQLVSSGTLVLDDHADPELTVEILTRAVRLCEPQARYITSRILHAPDLFPTEFVTTNRGKSAPFVPASISSLEDLVNSWRPWQAYGALILDGWTSERQNFGPTHRPRAAHAARMVEHARACPKAASLLTQEPFSL